MPRKGSVVTFDISEPTVRRHSSPAPSLRCKDIGGAGRPDAAASSSSSSPNTGTKATNSREKLTTASTGSDNPPPAPARHHPLLEKRNSSRSRRSEQSSVLSVVDENCLADGGGVQRSKLPKSASDIKPVCASTTFSSDRSRSSLDCGSRVSSSSAFTFVSGSIIITQLVCSRPFLLPAPVHLMA